MVDSAKDYSLLLIGRGIVGVTQLYDIVRNINLDKISEGSKVHLHSLDPKPHSELGGPAYSVGGPINKYPFVTTNTLPYKTDATEEKLLKPFLEQIFTTKRGKELQQVRSEIDWKDLKDKLENNKEVYLPRILIGEFGKHLWEKIEGIVSASKGKIELHEHIGLATEVSSHSVALNGKDTFLVNYKDSNNEIQTIQANTLYDAGRRAKRIGIKDSDGNEINHPNIIQNPLEQFGINENTFAKAKADSTPLKFVLKGFGNTGMDFFSVLNDLAIRYDVPTEIVALQRHNEGLVKHPAEKPNPDFIKGLEEKFKTAKTADDLWSVYSEEYAKTKYKPGELITQDRGDRPNVGESTNRPQHVADGLRGVINNVVKEFDIENQEKWYQNYNSLYLKDRNRVTYALGAKIEEAQTSGRLTIVTGEIKNVDAGDKGVGISIALKNGDKHLDIKGENVYLINAVAPKVVLDDSLSKSLFEKNIAKKSDIDGYETKKGSVEPISKSDNFFIAANILFCRPEHTGLSNIGPALKGIREAISDRIDQYFSKKVAEVDTSKYSLSRNDDERLPPPLLTQARPNKPALQQIANGVGV